jgi:hypothetical protein
MATPQPGPEVLRFYAHALTLSAFLLCKDVPLQRATLQALVLAMLAWLLVNCRQLAED